MAFDSHISDTCEKVSSTYSHTQSFPALNWAIVLYYGRATVEKSDHQLNFNKNARISENLTFLTPWYP